MRCLWEKVSRPPELSSFYGQGLRMICACYPNKSSNFRAGPSTKCQPHTVSASPSTSQRETLTTSLKRWGQMAEKVSTKKAFLIQLLISFGSLLTQPLLFKFRSSLREVLESTKKCYASYYPDHTRSYSNSPEICYSGRLSCRLLQTHLDKQINLCKPCQD